MKKVFLGVLLATLGMGIIGCGSSAIELEEHNKVVKELETIKSEKETLKSENASLKKDNIDLTEKIEEAKPFFDMKEEERIALEKEAQKAEEERIAAEKAEEERIAAEKSRGRRSS